MSIQHQNLWTIASLLVVVVLLMLWLSAGLLAAIAVAAFADLALTAYADRRSRSSRARAEVTDR